jgi:DNA-binding response OmpR family regulator
MINLKSVNVLFLEDNEVFAQNTIKTLDIYFNEIIHCISIQSAIKLFDEEDIGIIISDLKVSDGNALEFIEYVRSKNTNIPIIILSAHKDEKFLFKAIPLNITSYELKPLNFSNFTKILEKCSLQLNKNKVHIKDSIFYDLQKKILIKDNLEIKLTKNESIFIELLIDNRNHLVTRETINETIWENKSVTQSALKNLLLRLRKKVSKDLFTSIQNLGYQL